MAPTTARPTRVARAAQTAFLLFCLIILPASGPDGVAQAQQPAPPLAIGYLPEGSDFQQADRLFRDLAEQLAGRPALVRAMQREGFEGFQLSAAADPRDLVQRMNEGEFDLVFATAVVFVRQRGPYAEPILQTRLPGDLAPGGRNSGGVLRRGVVFIGPAHPLFRLEELTVERWPSLFANTAMVVPTADSMAGYIAPRLALSRLDPNLRPTGVLFAGTDAEVVKHVVSGVTNLGACREGVLNDLVPGDQPERFYRVLFQTDPFPTDVVTLHTRWQPSLSDLGRELKVALREYFNQGQEILPDLRLENADPRAFEALRRQLGTWRPPQLDPEAVRPRATPAPTPRPRPVLPEAMLDGGRGAR